MSGTALKGAIIAAGRGTRMGPFGDAAPKAILPIANRLDRVQGESNFKLAQWIPKYLHWYLYSFGPPLTAEQVRAHQP